MENQEIQISFMNCQNNEEIIISNPDYVKLYIKVKKRNGETLLSLSEETDNLLYLISNKRLPNTNSYFLKASTISEIPINPSKESFNTESEPSVKRVKQKTLFSFLKK